MSAADKFAAELREEFRLAVPVGFARFHQAIHLRALKSCIDLSAVDTGRLRNNWQSAVGDPGMQEFPEGSSRESSQLADAASVLEGMDPYGVSYVSNPLEYASYLEDGTPKMEPQPMVRPTVAAIESWAANLGKGNA